MNITRRLTEGVGSWLAFEFACDRSGLFSEKYLTVPIGQILSAWGGSRVLAEYRHPVLAPLKKGSGRRPEVDFVLFSEYPTIKYAIESKWIGDTPPSVESILWDLVRLEMIANSDGAECFFILGGQKGKLEKLFNHSLFYGPPKPNQFRPILRTDTNNIHNMPLVPTITHRIAMLRKLFLKYQDIPFPHKIITSRSTPVPLSCTSKQYQIYAWKIHSAKNREIFYPRNSTHYRVRYSEI